MSSGTQDNDRVADSAGCGPARECSQCGTELVRINLLIDGEEITMLSCTPCDRRTWLRRGSDIELGGVLTDLSHTPTRYRRDLASS